MGAPLRRAERTAVPLQGLLLREDALLPEEGVERCGELVDAAGHGTAQAGTGMHAEDAELQHM